MRKELVEPGSVTTSKFTRFLWLFFVGSVVFFGFNVYLSMNQSIPGRGSFFSIISLAPILISWIYIWSRAWNITIDKDLRSITFRRFIIKNEITYSFNELDGFVEVYVPQKRGEVKVVYLVKDGIFCKKISESIYSNLDELEGALAPLKFLGVRKLNLAKTIAIIRKRPVI